MTDMVEARSRECAPILSPEHALKHSIKKVHRYFFDIV